MEKFKWIIFTVVVVGFMVFIVSLSNESKINVDNIDVNVVQVASEKNGNIADHTSGNLDSKVILIEYADYQCPGCASISPIIRLMKEDYKDQILFVFRNFPIPSIHNNAKSSAAAAEAAGLQGKYWEMHYKIFETQFEWQSLDATKRTDFYIKLAKDFNLNVDKFKEDMSSSEVDTKIKFDMAVAKKSKIEETPSFILNGKKVDFDIASDNVKFRDLINQELIKFNITPPAVIE